MIDNRGDWPQLVAEAMTLSTFAVELSALSALELPGLIDYLERQRVLPFGYVSVHAPSKGFVSEEEMISEVIKTLWWADAIVVHPDMMDDVDLYKELGRKLVIENMDARKETGRTADELQSYFDALPEAGLCFDIAHAKSVDSGLNVGYEMLERFGSRVRHVHLSSLDDGCHHVSLREDDEPLYAPLLDRCRDLPWILEAPPSLTT